MSREPSSPVHRYREALGRAGALDPPPAPKPKPKPGKRKFRVRVEPKKKTREEVLTKALTTTVQLTAEERGLLRELRAVHPDAAGQALTKIRAAKAAKKGK